MITNDDTSNDKGKTDQATRSRQRRQRLLQQVGVFDPLIESITLVNQPLDTARIQNLAKALTLNQSITSLNLSGCSLGDEGALELATALEKNTSLKFLHLCNNQIGRNGANKLAEVLEIHESLVLLDLQDNPIGPLGAKAISLALHTNHTLKTLNLSDVSIGHLGTLDVKAMFSHNTTLTNLTLSGKDIPPQLLISIANSLHQNRMHCQSNQNGVLTVLPAPSSPRNGHVAKAQPRNRNDDDDNDVLQPADDDDGDAALQHAYAKTLGARVDDQGEQRDEIELRSGKKTSDENDRRYKKFTNPNWTLQENIKAVLRNLVEPPYGRFFSFHWLVRSDLEVAAVVLEDLAKSDMSNDDIQKVLSRGIVELADRYGGLTPDTSCARRLLYCQQMAIDERAENQVQAAGRRFGQ